MAPPEETPCTPDLYDKVCKRRFDNLETEFDTVNGRFDTMEKTMDVLFGKVDETNLRITDFDNKFFKGNGKEAYSIRIDRMEQDLEKDRKRADYWKNIAVGALVVLMLFGVEESFRAHQKDKKIIQEVKMLIKNNSGDKIDG